MLRALAHRLRTGAPSHIRASLLGTAGALLRLPVPDGPDADPLTFDDAVTVPVATAWGPGRAARVRSPSTAARRAGRPGRPARDGDPASFG